MGDPNGRVRALRSRQRLGGARVRFVLTVTEFLRTTATRLPLWELGACRHKTAERNVHRVRCGPELRVTDVTVRIARSSDIRLSGHKVRQTAERQALGAAWRDSGFVFTTTIDTPVDPRNASRAFSELAKEAGLGKWHIHELRHSSASTSLAQGVPVEVVSASASCSRCSHDRFSSGYRSHIMRRPRPRTRRLSWTFRVGRTGLEPVTPCDVMQKGRIQRGPLGFAAGL